MIKKDDLTYKNFLVEWIKQEVKKAHCKGVVVGISGGVDSALVSALAKEAFPNNSLGIIMPIVKMDQDLLDAKLVVKHIDIKTKIIDLSNTYNAITKEIKIQKKLAKANIKPRLRMTTLYAIAQENNYLVLGTDNAAEWILGYFTKYGDGGVDLLPIIHLTKRQVRFFVKQLKFPQKIWNKKASANLWDGQYDEEELGFSYEDVDNFLENKNINLEIAKKIQKQIQSTQHKRQPLPTPKNHQNFKKLI